MVLAPLFWIKVKLEGQMKLPEDVQKKGTIEDALYDKLTKKELKKKFGIEISESEEELFPK
jgi:hypothetical protein